MDNEIKHSVGKRIAMLRKMRDLKQSDLGQMIGRSQSVISAWEKGVADPGTEGIILIANALNVSPLELLGSHSEETDNIQMPDASMEPEIHEGDMLTVKKNVTLDDLRDGDTVLVDTHKGKGLIRRLFKISAQYMLLSFSPSIPPISVHNVDIKGKVTDIHRKL